LSKKDKTLISEIKATLNSRSELRLERTPSQRACNSQSGQIDSYTNIDSFLELDQNESSSNLEFYTPSNSKSSLNEIQEEEIFLKRKYQEINSSEDDFNTNLKQRHVEIFAEEKDHNSSFADLDFPFFLGFQDEKL